jgi:hypothetical protein
MKDVGSAVSDGGCESLRQAGHSEHLQVAAERDDGDGHIAEIELTRLTVRVQNAKRTSALMRDRLDQKLLEAAISSWSELITNEKTACFSRNEGFELRTWLIRPKGLEKSPAGHS